MNKTLMALAATMTLASPLYAAPIVTNGSFDAAIPAGATIVSQGNGFQVYDFITGWTTVSGAGIELQQSNAIPFTPHSGANYVELDSNPGPNSNSIMKQSVALGIGEYLLSFFYSPRTSAQGTNIIDFGITGLFASSVTGPGSNPTTEVGLWTEITRLFQVTTAGDYDLTFGASGTEETLGGFIDDVSIAAVPLPAGALLLLTAVGGFGIARRLRKA